MIYPKRFSFSPQIASLFYSSEIVRTCFDAGAWRIDFFELARNLVALLLLLLAVGSRGRSVLSVFVMLLANEEEDILKFSLSRPRNNARATVRLGGKDRPRVNKGA